MKPVDDARSELSKSDDPLLDALIEEFSERACAGDADVEAFVRRHPEREKELRRLLPLAAVMARLDQPDGSPAPTIEPTTVADADQFAPLAPSVPTIGPYRLHEKIGEGGMGIVYAAEQQYPVRRMVALKVIKPGMDTREVIARFSAERQALALMDHPHIAKVHDAGETELGRPYFAMEYVRGIALTEFCDRERLTTEERLKVFLSVCLAVQHAHQKGIIHRDLKPSNILVSLDGGAIPKVIDFGVAKALDEQLTEHTLHTFRWQMIGTPLYMSPEQARGLDIDTRTDIYSLGVVLYELLCGTTPFDREKLREASADQVRRMLCEEEPLRPSARLTTVGAALDTVAKRRASSPRQLALQLRRELDWIVMKCLEKDRARRYGTAAELAEDVQRFLDSQPVRACPPTRWYRFTKFARRNRVALATGLTIAVAALTATGVSVWKTGEAVRARRLAERREIEADGNLRLANERLESEQRARSEADRQRSLAEAHFDEADRQRKRAEANFEKAQEAVDQMLLRVADEKLANIPGLKTVREQLVKDALQFFEHFFNDTGDDWELRMTAARAWHKTGELRRRLDDLQGSIEAHTKAVQIGEVLLRERPNDIDCLKLLARGFMVVGTSYHREEHYEFRLMTDMDREFENILRSGVLVSRRLVELQPDVAASRDRLAGALQALGTFLCTFRTGSIDEPIALLREAVELQQEVRALPGRRIGLIWGLEGLAQALVVRAPEEADRLFAEAQELCEAEIREGHRVKADEPSVSPEFALVLLLTARSKIPRWTLTDADLEAIYRRALTAAEFWFEANPESASLRLEYSHAGVGLARILSETGHEAQADTVLRELCRAHLRYLSPHPNADNAFGAALESYESFLAGHPARSRQGLDDVVREFALRLDRDVAALPRLQSQDLDDLVSLKADELSTRMRRDATWLVYLGRDDAAKRLYQPILDHDGGSGFVNAELAAAYFAASQFCLSVERHDRAIELCRKAVEVDPGNRNARRRIACCHDEEGRLEEAVAAHRDYLSMEPDDAFAHRDLAWSLYKLRRYEESIAESHQALQRNPTDTNTWICLGHAHAMEGRIDDAVAAYREAVALVPKEPLAYSALAEHLALRGDEKEAIDFYEQAIDCDPKFALALNNAAWILATTADERLRDASKALEFARRAVQLWPESSPYQATFGAAAYRAGRYDEALAALQKALGLTAERSGRESFLLAMTYAKLNRPEQARQSFDEAVAWMNTNKPDDAELRRFHTEATKQLDLDGDKR